MKNKALMFWGIVIIVLVSAYIIFANKISLGLDLVGGSRVIVEAQTTETIPEITQDMMDSLKLSLTKRVNAIGVSETTIQQYGTKRILIEIPNVSDPEKAKEFIGETAELEFKQPKVVQNGAVIEWESTGLTGKDLQRADVTTGKKGTDWAVSLEFTPEGAKKFGELTTKLVGQQMAIFFNGKEESAPVINEPIMEGRAEISGNFTHDDAKKMVDLLNAGALPVPAKIIQINTVGPTLGSDSIQKSEIAGAIGIVAVMIFMIITYRLPGLIADIALVIYALITFAVFDVIHVTLTLAGIAGFILSIGMAVDANVLIFERTKEELKTGRTLFTAINAGFDRAFPSIIDSNMTTILICAVLCIFGTSVVKGFAVTLVIGVLASMFTAITVTRNFMHLFFGTGQLKHPEWFGLKKKDISEGYSATETKREDAKFGVLD